jgi:hypothetical protein
MVLQGQDKWRKNPLIAGMWKKPFPHLPLAIGIFASYCAIEYVYDKATEIPAATVKPSIRWQSTGIDTTAEPIKIGGDHH